MKTNRKHFELFKKEFTKWQKHFGLEGWDITFIHDGGKNEADHKASITVNWKGQCATITLLVDWKDWKITDEQIIISAKHEAIHLLLGHLGELATLRFVRYDELYAAEEEIVNKLVRLIGYDE